jgi:hypothetical protein
MSTRRAFITVLGGASGVAARGAGAATGKATYPWISWGRTRLTPRLNGRQERNYGAGEVSGLPFSIT